MTLPQDTLNVAPVNRSGPLPRGLTPNLLRRALEPSHQKSAARRVKSVLRDLGIAPLADSQACRAALRRALDDPKNRARLEEFGCTLPKLLWLHARKQPSGARVYAAIFAPAEYRADEKTYLSPERFENAVSTLTLAAQADLCGTDECAMLVLGFGLLQPDDAASFVETLLAAAPEQAAFFSPSTEIVTDAPKLDQPGNAPADVPPAVEDGVHGVTRDVTVPANTVPVGLPEETTLPSPDALTSEVESGPNLRDPFVEGTHALLREIGECQSALLSAVAGARYEELPGLQMALERPRVALARRFRQKEAELGVAEGMLPVPSPPTLTTAEGVRHFIGELALKLIEAVERSVKRVGSERDRYVNELHALGLLPPQDLDAAGTLAQVAEIRLQDAERIREAHFRRSLREQGDAHKVVREAVAPQRRLQIYFEESLYLGADPTRLKQWLVADQPAACSSPRLCVKELMSALHGWLRRSAALPNGLWSLAADIDLRTLVEGLADPELAGLLASHDPEAVCGAELGRVVASDLETIHRSLQRFLRRVQSRDAPAASRVKLLAGLVLEDQTDALTVVELLGALATSDRREELWLLSDALIRADVLVELPDELRPSFLEFVARRAEVDGPHLTMLGDLVDNDDWVGEDIDALTVLLFLAVRTGKGRVVLFRHSRKLAGLRAAHPRLFDKWLRPKLEGVASRLDDDALARAWRVGHDAVRNWEIDIQKRTCFRALRFGQDYQRAIRDRLEAMLAAVVAGTLPSQIDPEDLIEAVRSENDLPTMKHPALGVISDYIRDQSVRLRAIAEAIAFCNAEYSDLLAHADPPDREELREELAEAFRARALAPHVAIIYRYAVRESP
jgi:hypothetical protein